MFSQATRIQLALANGTLMDFTPVSPLWRAVQVSFLQHCKLLCSSAVSVLHRLQTSNLIEFKTGTMSELLHRP